VTPSKPNFAHVSLPSWPVVDFFFSLLFMVMVAMMAAVIVRMTLI